MAYEHLELLLHLAKKGALCSSIRTSTGALAEQLGVSQQTASRNLREMEENGLVKRKVSNSGVQVELTDAAQAFMKEHFHSLKELLFQQPTLCGALVTGIGEGGYYMSFKQYQSQFKEILGKETFFGTLNLSVKEEEVKRFLLPLKHFRIKGFTTAKRTFGGLTFYPVLLQGTKAGIIFPDRGHHREGIIEIVSPLHLRRHFGLADGATVTISSQEGV